MGLNVSTIIAGAGAVAKSTAKHPITKGGSLAALLTGGLYIAAAAGVAIPEIAYTLGPIAGVLLYKFLPKEYQEALDSTTEKIVDTFDTLPSTYAEYPANPNSPSGTSKTNLKTKDGNTVNSGK